tara:strand:+ start:15 stop:374 length:360 start_codon:yes stop_codon:yes gene_type:complete
MAKTNFKKRISLEERKNEASRIFKKYPERIPIIVERSNSCKSIGDIDRNKFLVPADLSMGQFMHIIRQRIKLDSSQAMYLFIGDSMAPTSKMIAQIYNDFKDEDGFLYVTYASESTFGN